MGFEFNSYGLFEFFIFCFSCHGITANWPLHLIITGYFLYINVLGSSNATTTIFSQCFYHLYDFIIYRF
jgi:hypothetical protein